MSATKRALIAAIPPSHGGVTAMLGVTAQALRSLGIEPTFAWYEPWSMTPELSVPFWRLGRSSVSSVRREVLGDPEEHQAERASRGYAIGAYLPELEFTHYRATRPWRDLIACHELHLVVSGTAMAGRAFMETGTPFLAWLASDWYGDRKDRVRTFPAIRRVLDVVVVQPRARSLERRILRTGRVLALSRATQNKLIRIVGTGVEINVLSFPVDTELFRPDASARVPGRIGFVGRFDDPRKNLALFLRALAEARRSPETGGAPLTAVVLGASPDDRHREIVRSLDLGHVVRFLGRLSRREFAQELRTVEVLAVTSHQEGLHIGALEAMASGVPVVSTRCGGPEEYVQEEVTGLIGSFAPESIAGCLLRLRGDSRLRDEMGRNARKLVEDRYSPSGSFELLREEIRRFPYGRKAECVV